MEIKVWYTMPEPTRERLCAWVQANDLDPKVIPMGSTIRVESDSVTVEEYAFDADGKMMRDPHDPNSALRTTRTVPLLVPWPVGVSA
jgi:hypothetical protein